MAARTGGFIIEKAMMAELREYGGANGHPMFKRCRASQARKGLHKAQTSGEVEKAKVAVLAGSTLFGPDDQSVRKLKMLMVQVEHCERVCRECLSSQSLRQAVKTMPQISKCIETLKRLQFDLGPKVWDNMWLARAKDRFEAWNVHKVMIRTLARKNSEGPEALCAAWAELACSTLSLKQAFGPAVTQELLLTPSLGSRMVHALAAVEVPSAATPEAQCALMQTRITGMCHLLSSLDNKDLDCLLLSIGPEGCSALEAAARLPDSSIFLGFYRALLGEACSLESPLEQHVYKQGLHTVENTTSLEYIAARIGRAMGFAPEDVFLWHHPSGGVGVRFFVVSNQPGTTRAEELLGPGVAKSPGSREDVYAAELAKWGKADAQAREYFTLYDELPLAKARKLEATTQLQDATAAREAATQQRATLAAQEADRQGELATAREEETKAREARKEQSTKTEDLGRSAEDDAEDLYQEALKDLVDIEEQLRAKISYAEEAQRQHEAAKDALQAAEEVECTLVAEHEAAQQLLASTTEENTRMLDRHALLLRTPFAQFCGLDTEGDS